MALPIGVSLSLSLSRLGWWTLAYSFLRTVAEGGCCGGGKSGADDPPLASRYQSSEGASRRSTSGQKSARTSLSFSLSLSLFPILFLSLFPLLLSKKTFYTHPTELIGTERIRTKRSRLTDRSTIGRYLPLPLLWHL